jgi:hypothetical protein
MAATGRKSKLTKSLIDKACKVLRAGNYVKTTCGYLSICESSWYDWIREGNTAIERDKKGIPVNDDEKLKIEFVQLTQKAQDEAIVRNIQIIQQAAQRNWQAAAWYLERTKPDLFAAQHKLTVDATPAKLTLEEARKVIEERKQKQLKS